MSDIQAGDTVRFHPIIGGKHDGNVYTVTETGRVPGGPRVCKLSGKSGWIVIEAISRYQPGADNYGLQMKGGDGQDMDNYPEKWEGGAAYTQGQKNQHGGCGIKKDNPITVVFYVQDATRFKSEVLGQISRAFAEDSDFHGARVTAMGLEDAYSLLEGHEEGAAE